MKINRFYINIIIRILLIALTCLIFIWLLYETRRIFSMVFAVILLIIQVYWLIYYVNRTNRELALFLMHIQELDTTQAFSTKNIEKTFSGLHHSFEKINKEIRKIQFESVNKEQLLNIIVSHVGIGILSFNESGRIILLNKAAKKLLNIDLLNNVKDLNRQHKGLSDIIMGLKPENQKILKLNIGDEILQLSANATIVKSSDEIITLLSLQDIRNELDEKELESWQKLIRVLTHEISNSITPINTLTTAIKHSLTKNKRIIPIDELDQETVNDTVATTQLIEERSQGLINFVGKYRSLTHLPKPDFTKIKIKQLFFNIQSLFKEEMNNNKIRLSCNIKPESLEITADNKLIEQILINLVKNSIQALENTNNGKINLYAESENNSRIAIKVSDNGPGIPKEILNDIFIPFYTTRNDGSGIGLSLSKQIMRVHGGTINVKSKPSIETVFILRF